MNIDGILDSLAWQNEQKPQEGDYMQDNLLICGKCNTPKQCEVEILDEIKKFGCMCKCQSEKYREEQAKQREREEFERVNRLRTQGIQDRNFREWTFENDDGSNPKQMDKAMRYCLKWDEMYRDNIGLLLWGNVGTGKTFFAACIANYLIEHGVPVLMTNFIRLTNALTGFDEDKNAYIRSLNNYKLLIIDDLGAERQSDYMLEQVYNMIDNRYKNNQPLIITTNLTLNELKNPSDIKYSRIYSRIFEMCVPIRFDGTDRRKEVSASKLEKAKKLFE
jgi:DNA replication protein DnaC